MARILFRPFRAGGILFGSDPQGVALGFPVSAPSGRQKSQHQNGIEDAQVIRLCVRLGEATGPAWWSSRKKTGPERKGTMMRRCAAAACPAGRIVDLGGVSPDEDCASSPELLMVVGGRDHSLRNRAVGMRRARDWPRADARDATIRIDGIQLYRVQDESRQVDQGKNSQVREGLRS